MVICYIVLPSTVTVLDAHTPFLAVSDLISSTVNTQAVSNSAKHHYVLLLAVVPH